MATKGQLFTLGVWRTKAGKEDEFRRAWQSLADWTSRSVAGAGTGTLLQHEDTPQRFISFGPWDSSENAAEWRRQPEFIKFVAKARDLCEEFEPQNMILVGQSGVE